MIENRTVAPSRPALNVRAVDAPVNNKPAPVVNEASKGESRLEQQQRYFSNMWTQLGQDARLAAIMINPLFMVHAQAIANAAVARAIRRYELEVPQKDFSVLYAEENAKARQAILNLPDLYAAKGEEALNATGAALLDAYDTTSAAVITAAETTGNFFVRAGQVIVGGIAAVVLGGIHGIGKLFSAVGGAMEGVGE